VVFTGHAQRRWVAWIGRLQKAQTLWSVVVRIELFMIIAGILSRAQSAKMLA
jgi:hypothetical protein